MAKTYTDEERQQLLDETSDLQGQFWAALGRLESALGEDIASTIDLGGITTVAQLKEWLGHED